jgi:large subunit ribosomal protein L21
MAKIAVIETGGKQYVVEKDSVLTIEKLTGVSKKGDKVTFENVLLTDDGSTTEIGTPFLKGVAVTGEFIAHGREKKVTVIRYREKSRYFKKKGHRQSFTKVKITNL